MSRVVPLLLAAVGGAVLGFLLGGIVATGTGASESNTALFQMVGALLVALAASAALAFGRKPSK
jgi:hypothetical protein